MRLSIGFPVIIFIFVRERTIKLLLMRLYTNHNSYFSSCCVPVFGTRSWTCRGFGERGQGESDVDGMNMVSFVEIFLTVFLISCLTRLPLWIILSTMRIDDCLKGFNTEKELAVRKQIGLSERSVTYILQMFPDMECAAYQVDDDSWLPALFV